MNTFRDPATNVSIHVPHENDDPTYRGRAGQRVQEWMESGAISMASRPSTAPSPSNEHERLAR